MSSEHSTGVSPGEQTAASKRISGFLNLTLTAVASFRIGQFLAKLPIAAPFQYDYEEGNILNALSRILHGQTPYPDPHALPNVINPYGPAAYYLLAIPAKVFGVAFVYPRAMIIGCALLIALFIGLVLRRDTRSTPLALGFALVLLAIPNIEQWAWILRVDLLGIAFTAAGLMVFNARMSDGGRQNEAKELLLPGLLFAVALLVKPTLIAAPAACFFFMIGQRDFGRAAKLAGTTAAVFLAVIGIFAAITHGAVITDVFFSHPDPFSFRVYTQGMTEMLVTSWPLVVLAVIAVARDLGMRRLSPAVLWVVFATATAITAGKLGSNRNHFLEWNAALCVAAGIGLSEVLKIRNGRVALISAAIAIGATALVISRQPDYLANVNPERGCPAAYDWARTQAGPNLLSENVGALVMGNKKVWVSNPFVLAQLAEHGGWSDAELVQMVRERRFDAVLTRMDYTGYSDYMIHGTERFSPHVLAALRDNYTSSPGFDCLDMNVVYRPKSPPAIQSK